MEALEHPGRARPRTEQAGPALREDLADCWVTVSEAGGAAGFPSRPVERAAVAAAAGGLIAALGPRHGRLPAPL